MLTGDVDEKIQKSLLGHTMQNMIYKAMCGPQAAVCSIKNAEQAQALLKEILTSPDGAIVKSRSGRTFSRTIAGEKKVFKYNDKSKSYKAK